MKPQLGQTLPRRPGQPQIHRDPPASASQMVGLKATPEPLRHRKTWVYLSLYVRKEIVYKMIPMTLRYLTVNKSFISLYSPPSKNFFISPFKIMLTLFSPSNYQGQTNKQLWHCARKQGQTSIVHPTKKTENYYTNIHHHN